MTPNPKWMVLLVASACFLACPSAGPVDGGAPAGGAASVGGGSAGGGAAGGGASCLTACPLTACGDLPDGCGGVLRCGGCPVGETCGGGGTPNGCAVGTCNPTSCQAAGKNCGQLSDGCGVLLDCGTCANGTTCGAQLANVCDAGTCTPQSCAQQGKTCGTVSDGCGQSLACGSCGANESCTSANVCQRSCPLGCPTGYTCDARGICSGGSGTFTVDLVSHTVRGMVTVNGVNPTTAAASSPGSPNQMVVIFTNTQNGARSTATISCPGTTGQACPGAFVVELFPGVYRVSVFGSGLTELPNVPTQVGLQGLALEVLPALQVTAPMMGVALNVVTVPMTITFTINGAPPANSPSPNVRSATLFAAHANTGQLTPLIARCPGGAVGTPCRLVADARLPPGPHRIVRISNISVAELPIGSGVLLESAVFMVSPGQPTVTVDLEVITVRGALTVNGDAGVALTSTFANVTFEHLDGGSPISAPLSCAVVGARCESAFSTTLFAGSYRVLVRADAMSTFPFGGTYVFDPALAVTRQMAPLAIDVPTVRIGGRVTVNGAAPRPLTAQAPWSVNVSLTDTVRPLQRSTITVDCFDPMSPCAGTFSEYVFRGRSLASFSSHNVAELPPQPAQSPAVSAVDTTSAPPTLTLDVLTTTVMGGVTVNGQPPTISSQADAGAAFGVRLSGPGLGEVLSTASPCPTSTPQASCPISFSARVFQGTVLNAEASGYGFNELPFSSIRRPSWPYGRAFSLEAVTVGAQPVTVMLDAKTGVISGTVTVNGATPQRATGTTAAPLLQLTNRATGALLSSSLACATTPPAPACVLAFREVVPRGVYELAIVPQGLVNVPGGPSTRWVIGDPVEVR